MWRFPSLNKIGADQFTDLAKSTPIALLCQIINITLVSISLYSVTNKYLIVSWWIINLVMSSWTIWRWMKNRHRVITRISKKAIPRAVFSGVLYALPWSVLVLLFLGNIPHHEELVMGVTVAGMVAAGSVQLAVIYPAALAYLGTILVPVFFRCIVLDEFQYTLLGAISFVYIIYLVAIILNTSKASIERSTALNDLKVKVKQLDLANDTLEKLAAIDHLTGLPNRRGFQDELSGAIKHANCSGGKFSLFVCDLDHFKNINDISGHSAGDILLQKIARRLKNVVQENDVVARIGGDEFAIIVRDHDCKLDDTNYIRKLINNVKRTVTIEGTKVDPGISIGAAVYPADANNGDDMMLYAGLALQHGKTISRGQHWFFDSKLNSKLKNDAALENELKIAIEENQFELFYQPKVNIENGKLYGLESLLRWRHPNGDIRSPNSFFSVAEERGLMSLISDFVVKQAVADICSWNKSGNWPGTVSINIHPVQIIDRHRMHQLVSIVNDAGVLASQITLEITEECIVGRGTDEVPDILNHMRENGFKISFDDFGTGYASLTHLKTLPVDEIKLDRSFISDLDASGSDRAIVLAMINLASSLGLLTVAEGVENENQHALLLAMGCSLGQGYYYSKPMNHAATTQYLTSAGGARDLESIAKISQLADNIKTHIKGVNKPLSNIAG